MLQGYCWNYGDIFIVVLAVGISFRFNQLNDYFRLVIGNDHLMTAATFRDLRIHYFQLIDLVRYVDSKVSGLIIISMGHNMLVLIVKIFNAFK
jgi:Trehalose receptor